MNPIAWVMDGGAKALLGAIPKWVWIALAGAAVLGLCVWLHSRAVKSAHDAAYHDGYNAGTADGVKAQAAADARAQAINSKLRNTNDEENRRIAAGADDMRMRGPGKARACVAPKGSSASGHIAPGGAAAPAVAEVPDPERIDLIALPFAGAVSAFEQCDANRAEVLKWRESDRLQSTPSQ